MMAKVYAKLGYIDNCLACLRKAKENGYRDLGKVYKDEEFSSFGGMRDWPRSFLHRR